MKIQQYHSGDVFMFGNISNKPQYKTYYEIFIALKNEGLEVVQYTFSRKEARCYIRFNGQDIGQLMVGTGYLPRTLAIYERDKATEQVGNMIDDLFEMSYCHYGNLAYRSTLPKSLTEEEGRKLMYHSHPSERPESWRDWIKGCSEAIYIINAIMSK